MRVSAILNTTGHSSRLRFNWGSYWVLLFLLTSGCGRAVEKSEGPGMVVEAKHSPSMPHSREAVRVSARLKEQAESVTLEYQIVEPGKYVGLKDSDYQKNWVALAM